MPKDEELNSYLEAYFGDRLQEDQRALVISKLHQSREKEPATAWFDNIASFVSRFLGTEDSTAASKSPEETLIDEATNVASLLVQSTEEMDSVLEGLDGGFIKPAPGGGKCISVDSVCFLLLLLSITSFLDCDFLSRFAARRPKRFTDWPKHPRP